MENTVINAGVETHQNTLYGHALKLTRDIDDAHDLVQDTMLKAMKFYNNFNEGTNLQAWLFVIMKNTFINKFNRKVKTQNMIIQSDNLTSTELFLGSESNKATGSLILSDIAKALKLLPEECATVFKKHFEGYKYIEIAQELEIPIGTVKTRIRNARVLLRKYLRPYQDSWSFQQ